MWQLFQPKLLCDGKSASYCNPATKSGRVQLWVDQSSQTDYSGPFKPVTAKKKYSPLDSNEARWGVRSAEVNWRSK